jgi:ubiquinone/menaquinone biosynthesis C-methylase UbiE
VFLQAAADRGAAVYGLDASEALLELARERVPEADLCLGDLEALPYEDDLFGVVAGFNSFFFAVDLVGALREAGRSRSPRRRS